MAETPGDCVAPDDRFTGALRDARMMLERAISLYDAAAHIDREQGVRPTSNRSVGRHCLGASLCQIQYAMRLHAEHFDGDGHG